MPKPGNNGQGLVACLRFHDLAGPLSTHGRGRTNGSARRHADRVADGPESRPRDRTAAGAHTSRQVVVCKVAAPLGFRSYLTGTFAGKTSSHGANRCAGRHPDRPSDRAQSRASCGPAASTDALGEVLIGQIVLPAGIGNLARALAGKTTCEPPRQQR